jgi:SAM-dependent methyltransferase
VSNFQNLVRHYAELKFGKDNQPAVEKWVGYWTDTLSRNFDLVRMFHTRTEFSFQGKTVLDIGCGSGGLSKIVTEGGGYYIGSDFFPAILEMAQAFFSDLAHPEKASLIRASGTHLPLAEGSIDVIIAFDVIEHLEGGESWQQSFLNEIRRILRPGGILLLTTPNRLYPWEGHTFMWGPQYLPVWLADKYIRWKNPSFLQEYRTYGQVKLLGPRKMKRLLDRAGLKVIHDFPCGMDWDDYPRRRRMILRALKPLGLGWGYTSAFWFSACREEDWIRLRLLRKKSRGIFGL